MTSPLYNEPPEPEGVPRPRKQKCETCFGQRKVVVTSGALEPCPTCTFGNKDMQRLAEAVRDQAEIDAENEERFRDAAAIAAMQKFSDGGNIESIAAWSFEFADAMVAERRRRDGGATE